MKLTERDRRALLLLGVALILGMAYRYATAGAVVGGSTALASDTVEAAENRLARVRRLAAQVPAREALLKESNAELKRREAGLIQADTAAQAQAQLVQVVRKIARAQTPPIDIRGQEMGQIRPFGDQYGEIVATLQFECGVDQLVNMMSELTNQSGIVSTNEMLLVAANEKSKTVPVRLTVSALVPKRLVPAKKGNSTF